MAFLRRKSTPPNHGAGASAGAAAAAAPKRRADDATDSITTDGSILDKGVADATLSDDTMRGLVASYQSKAKKPKKLPKCFDNDSAASLVIPQKKIKAALKKIPADFTIQYLIDQKIQNLKAIITAYKIVNLEKEYKLIKAFSESNNDVTFEDFQNFFKKERRLPTTKRAEEGREALRQQGMGIPA